MPALLNTVLMVPAPVPPDFVKVALLLNVVGAPPLSEMAKLPLTLKAALLLKVAPDCINSVPVPFQLVGALLVKVRPIRDLLEPFRFSVLATVKLLLPLTVPELQTMSVALTLPLPASVPPERVRLGVLVGMLKLDVPPLRVMALGLIAAVVGEKLPVPPLLVRVPKSV